MWIINLTVPLKKVSWEIKIYNFIKFLQGFVLLNCYVNYSPYKLMTLIIKKSKNLKKYSIKFKKWNKIVCLISL